MCNGKANPHSRYLKRHKRTRDIPTAADCGAGLGNVTTSNQTSKTVHKRGRGFPGQVATRSIKKSPLRFMEYRNSMLLPQTLTGLAPLSLKPFSVVILLIIIIERRSVQQFLARSSWFAIHWCCCAAAIIPFRRDSSLDSTAICDISLWFTWRRKEQNNRRSVVRGVEQASMSIETVVYSWFFKAY